MSEKGVPASEHRDSDPARVAVTLDVAAAVQGRGGIGRYSARLAEALARRGDVALTLLYHGRPTIALPPALRTLPARAVPLGSKPWRAGAALATVLGVPLDRWLGAHGVFHATDHLLPPLRRAPTVFTVHDLAFLTRPETHRRANQAFLARMLPRFCAAATLVIADSEATRQDLLRYYALPPAKVRAVPLGVEPDFRPQEPRAARALVAEHYGLTGPYLLFVGTLEPRKNLRRLLLAYRRLLQARGPAQCPPLAIAGARGWWVDGLLRAAREWGLAPHVRWLGRVPDAHLPALYSACTAFVYPSLYEGFGLPALEALACGAPTVTSACSALPEVVGDAALRVDPYDVGALASALDRLLTDEALRRALAQRGPRRAAQFTWERTAAATVAVYRDALRLWRPAR